MIEKLLPCPFTGDIPSIKTSLSSSQFIDGKYLEVHQCVFILPEYKIVTSIQTDGEESVEDRAIRFWNTRVYPEEVQEAIERDKPRNPVRPKGYSNIECPTCGAHLKQYYEPEEANVPFCYHCGQRLDWGRDD